MEKLKRDLLVAKIFLMAFLVWTAIVCFVDVQPIGPAETCVGLATLNQCIHQITGVHWGLYTVTDWLGLVPVVVGMSFGILGLMQWIVRKSIEKVDWNILVLGGFYVLTIIVYLFFETVVVNYRPVLIDGVLEASYPSSTTLLVMCVMPTAIMQCSLCIKHRTVKRYAIVVLAGFTAFMVIGRLISGVHWCSDIIGGVLLSAGLVMLYSAFCGLE